MGAEVLEQAWNALAGDSTDALVEEADGKLKMQKAHDSREFGGHPL